MIRREFACREEIFRGSPRCLVIARGQGAQWALGAISCVGRVTIGVLIGLPSPYIDEARTRQSSIRLYHQGERLVARLSMSGTLPCHTVITNTNSGMLEESTSRLQFMNSLRHSELLW